MTVKQFHISAMRNGVRVTGDEKQDLCLKADSFFDSLLKLPADRCLDFLNIAAGVYTVDRIVQKNYAGKALGIRNLSLTIEVNDLAFWRQPVISEAVAELLYFLSDDNWIIQFERSSQQEAGAGHQERLNLYARYQPTRLALFSGGLDSAAGLANQLIAGLQGYALLTVGHQSGIRKRATDQIESLQKILQIENLIHTTLVMALRGGKSSRVQSQERTQRTRAFLFCACAAIAAKALSVSNIELFENGVGSINAPLMTGMLVGGLATRGSHPSFLDRISALSSAVMDSGIFFSLPFQRQTKGEMLIPLKQRGLGEWAQKSHSCVHTSWRVVGKNHCGSCPACIERRQAFAVAKITEGKIYSTDIFLDPLKCGHDSAYFRLYKDEAAAWLRGDPRPRRRMKVHLRSTEIPMERDQIIYDLQTRHCQEVSAVFID